MGPTGLTSRYQQSCVPREDSAPCLVQLLGSLHFVACGLSLQAVVRPLAFITSTSPPLQPPSYKDPGSHGTHPDNPFQDPGFNHHMCKAPVPMKIKSPVPGLSTWWSLGSRCSASCRRIHEEVIYLVGESRRHDFLKPEQPP